MRIGKQDNASQPLPRRTRTQSPSGGDLRLELIGKVGFTDYFYFLVTGTMPTPVQRLMTDAVLVAIAEDGLVPSVQTAQMTW